MKSAPRADFNSFRNAISHHRRRPIRAEGGAYRPAMSFPHPIFRQIVQIPFLGWEVIRRRFARGDVVGDVKCGRDGKSVLPSRCGESWREMAVTTSVACPSSIR